MPRSKRNKVVHLTKVKKKTRDVKDDFIEKTRLRAEENPFIMLLRLQNQKNQWLKDIRSSIPDSVLACGKNKLMQKALGTTPAAECQQGVHKLATRLTGFNALMFSKTPPHAIISALESFHPTDYARCGAIATETVVIPRGHEACAHLGHSIEPHLRALGMPTRLKEGKIEMMGEFVAAREGKELTQDQAQVLKLMRRPMAEFSCEVLGIYYKKLGLFVEYDKGEKGLKDVLDRDTRTHPELCGSGDTDASGDALMTGA